MKCMSCGGKMKVRTAPYVFDKDGISATLLGVEHRRCASCGEEEVAIPAIDRLVLVIARQLIRKPSTLTPAEFRFLRKSVGWSAVDTSRWLGTTKETISRWENGQRPIPLVADHALRALVASRKPIEDYRAVDGLDAIAGGDPEPADLRFQRNAKQWRAAVA